MNEKEKRIADVQANRDKHPARAEPGHFYIYDLIEHAQGTLANKELAKKIEAHLTVCEACRAKVESFGRVLARDNHLAEPLLKGSLLELATTTGLQPKLKPTPSPQVALPAAPVTPATHQPEPCAFPPGYTIAAQDAAASDELWPQFTDAIRPLLAAYLDRNGTDRNRVEEVLTYIRPLVKALDRANPDDRLHKRIPEWVDAFRREKLSETSSSLRFEDVFERLIVDAELRERAESESGLPQAFCQAALKNRLKDAGELLRFEPAECRGAPWLPMFRVQLFGRVNARKTASASLFQLN